MTQIQTYEAETVQEQMKSVRSRIDPVSLLLRAVVWLAALTVAAIFVWLAGYIIIKGLPYLSPRLFEWEYSTENVSMLPAIVVTVLMVILALLFAAPVGMGAAIYLVEYARKGSRLVSLVRLTTESLAGIPSIVYGLFGFLLFVVACGMGFSILGGALTLAIMVLPLIMRTTEEALKSVPDNWREGSFALGAGRLRTIFCVVLPAAVPGILSGIILSIGRIVGESAALLYTAGTVAAIPESLFSSGRTLSVHMYALLSEGLYVNEAHATALVLLIMVLLINFASGAIAALFVRERS
ncbi:MAG TPA: phosphate ABC transporter permease PstA [Candidatus Mailhella merdavium]|nr:phosphate ABC transporter permease PstA [Candidatus Mailhella merdavium]